MVFWLIVSGIAVLGCGSGLYFLFKSPSRENREKLFHFLKQDYYEYIILDIRKKNHYIEGHIPGAIHVSPKDISNCYPSEDMFINIFICGRTNISAYRAVRYLNRNGYFQVSSLGAYHLWKGETASGEEQNESE